MDKTRDVKIGFRVTPEEKLEIKRKAKISGMNMAKYVRHVVFNAGDVISFK